MSISTDRLTHLLGADVVNVTPLTGGDVSEVVRATLADGRSIVAKRGGPVAVEARMLRAIAETGCKAPDVLAVGDDTLIMTLLAEGRGNMAGWAEAGRQIAQLHVWTGSSYGWDDDTALGAAPCPAGSMDDWPSFWAERRLMASPEVLPADVARRIEILAARLPELLPAKPPASLLHGDMWQGNVLLDGDNFSGLIDPACYHGDAEVDLATLHIFGTPPPIFLETYGVLRDGWQTRRPIYQLWTAIIHLRLFGSGYRGLVERLLNACDV